MENPGTEAAMTNGEAWPEFAEWQQLAAKERDFYAISHRNLSDEEADAIIEPIEQRMDVLEQQMREKPFRGSLVDAMALAIIALRHQECIGPGATKFDGGFGALYAADREIRSMGDLLRNVCMLAKETGHFPLLARSNFNPHPDLPLLDIADRCFRDGSPVGDKIVGMYAEAALALEARTSAGVQVKLQALAYLCGGDGVEDLPEKLRDLGKELAAAAA